MKLEKKDYKESTMLISCTKFDFYTLKEDLKDGELVAVDYSDGKLVKYDKGNTTECIGILYANLGKGQELKTGERGKVVRTGEINIKWDTDYENLDIETIEQLKIKDLYFKEFSVTETRKEID